MVDPSGPRDRARSRPRSRSVICLLLAVVSIVVAMPLDGVSFARRRPRRISGSRHIGPGVRFIWERDRRGPWRIKIISVDLDARPQMKIAIAHDKLNGRRETTSSMARRYHAIAAINGDFGWTRPVHAIATRGELLQWARGWWTPYNFAVGNEDARAVFGDFDYDAWTRSGRAPRRPLHSVNAGRPERRQHSLFSPEGSTLEKPPGRTCSARLRPLDRPRFVAGGAAMVTGHSVERVLCRRSPLWRRGGSVLSTERWGPGAEEISALDAGARVAVGWSTGRRGVAQSMGGFPLLVRRGRIARRYMDGRRPFFGRHPRTGVGYDADRNRLLLATVDGRRPGYSVGMKLRAFARVFKRRGCEWALNLDGGGSTTSVVRGRVRNRPSDGSERPVSSAVLVVPRRRAVQAPEPSAPSAGPSQAAAGLDALASDAGSTGGLVAVVRDLGVPLLPQLRAAARHAAR